MKHFVRIPDTRLLMAADAVTGREALGIYEMNGSWNDDDRVCLGTMQARCGDVGSCAMIRTAQEILLVSSRTNDCIQRISSWLGLS